MIKIIKNYCVTATVSILYLITFYWINSRTLDLTDEAYYLISIRDPSSYPITNGITKYAYIFHEIFSLTNSLLILRFTILFILCFLIYVFLWTLNKNLHFLEEKEIFYLTILSAPLTLFVPYGLLLSPSYNTLNLIGILFLSISILKKESLTKNFHIAVSLTLIYFARPTTFVLTSIFLIILIYKTNHKTSFIRNIFYIYAFTVSMVLAGYKYFDGSLANGYKNLISAWSLLDESHKIGLISNFIYQISPIDFYFFLVAATSFYMVFKINSELKFKESFWIRILFISLLPLLGSFGTNGNYWQQSATFFAVQISLIIFVIRSRNDILNVGKLIIYFIFIGLILEVSLALYQPFRSDVSIWKQNNKIEIIGMGSVRVSESLYSDLTPLVRKINQESQSGDKIFDSTSSLPGILLFTKIKASGASWTGTNDTALEMRANKLSKCEVGRNLLILQSSVNTNVRLQEITKDFELAFPNDFARIYYDSEFYFGRSNSIHELALWKSREPLVC